MTKTEAERCKKIEVWWLLKNIHRTNGFKTTNVSWGEDGNINVIVNIVGLDNYTRFIYSQTNNNTGESQNFDYKVQIVFTPCKFGGKRFWFVCPILKNNIPCKKRIGVLYKNGDYFGCRECGELTYKSKNKSRSKSISHFANVFDIEDEFGKIRNKNKRLSYRGKPTKTGKKVEQLYKRKLMAYRGFEMQEKGIKGRVFGRKMI